MSITSENNNLGEYNQNMINYENGNLTRIELNSRQPRRENEILIGNVNNYMGRNPSNRPIVEFICNECNQPITNRQAPTKVDLFCYRCNISYP
jgi:hypothetical protein